MGYPSLLVLLYLFLVTHLQVVHSSVSCPPSFDCGPLGPIKFPFTNTSHPSCGLYTVSCGEPSPKVMLGEDRRAYQISSIADRTINLIDPELKNLIKDCNFSRYTYIKPFNTPSISFAISYHNITVFKCNASSLKLKEEAEQYFRDNHYPPPYRGCEGGNYTVSYSLGNDPAQENLPTSCHSFQLPVSSSVEGWDPSGDVFTVLTSEFSVEYHLSANCSACLDGGGNCSRDPLEFRCFNERGEDCRACLGHHGICSSDSLQFQCLPGRVETPRRNRLALILGTVIPGVVLLSLLIHIFWHRNKWRNYISSCSMWRTSSDLCSKDDLEEGSAYFGIPVFSYSELKEATHNFDPSRELGDGGFGTVYFGKLRDGREVAVKRLYEHNCKRVAQFLNEIEILTKLRHPNLVTLYGCTSRHSRELLLVYEYIRNGTVADHLHGDRAKDHPLPWSIRMNIAVETASALVYLHASEIIHRDVKTNNILLDNNFHVKVADFGLSRLFPTDVSHVSTAPQGTPGYVDPDYHQCYQLTTRSDVYSFGVVLIELISSLPAVDISRHRHEINLANLAINRIQNGAFNELIDSSLGFESDSSVERMTTSVAEVAFRCLQLEKEMRPPMDEVYEALKEIQEYKDQEIGKMQPPSPDGDNFELLNCTRDAMTNRRVSI